MGQHVKTVAVASSNGLLRAALVDLVKRQPALIVIAACTSSADTRDAVASHRPDLLVIEGTRVEEEDLMLLLRLHRDLRIMLIGGRNAVARALVRTGAGVSVPASTSPDGLAEALSRFAPSTEPRPGARPSPPKPSTLSARQIAVLTLAAAGKTNLEIASLLDIAEGTVKRHLFDAFRVLSARSRVDAVNRARALGHRL